MRHIAEAVSRNCRLNPDAEAVADGTRRLTHAELANRAWAIGRGLRAAGVETGDSIGVLAGNTVFSAETFIGAVVAGGSFVPYNWRWTTEELVHGINETGARVILVAKEHVSGIEAALATGDLEPGTRVFVEGDNFEAMLVPGGELPLAYGPEDAATILFTGGTTGFSKGVVLSHRACLANAFNEIMDCRVAASVGDRGLISTPLFHSAALLCWFLPHYVAGRFVLLMNRFDEGHVAEAVTRERITNMFLVPNMIRRMLGTGAFEAAGFRASFRSLHSGAGLLRMPDKLALMDLMPDLDLYFRYGLTEAGPMVTRLLPSDVLRDDIDGSIGQEYLLAEVELRLDDGVTPARIDEIGEIYVRGPGLMTGYFGRPEATAEVLRDGWLQTGDLATRNADGYLFFRDRAKDMIKTGGENVYCSEIEQLLQTHGSVMEAAILGVPSLEWDEEVRAVISVREGHDLTEGEVRDFLRQRLASYKVPKVIVLVGPGQIPLNPSGKVVKSEVRTMVGW